MTSPRFGHRLYSVIYDLTLEKNFGRCFCRRVPPLKERFAKTGRCQKISNSREVHKDDLVTNGAMIQMTAELSVHRGAAL